MEENRFAPSAFAPEAGTDEPVSPANLPAAPTADADPPLISDCLGDTLAETLEATFPPGCRKPRHDGWTAEAVEAFLRALAATGVVDHAARTAGLSVTAAYNFRNSRRGRAFAKMWDAVLVHRTRARVASELSGRAIAGCVSVRKREGVVVGEYHYYDNRLAMSLLTRLDRLAEKEAASEAHLRSLSEDLEEFIDCVVQGGDAEAFVEARRPVAEANPGAQEHEAVPESEESELEEESGLSDIVVWQDPDGWWTSFPPPAGFDDYEEFEPGDFRYRRRLSPAELAAVEADEAARRAARVEGECARRDRHFGFGGGVGPSVLALFEKAQSAAPLADEEEAVPHDGGERSQAALEATEEEG